MLPEAPREMSPTKQPIADRHLDLQVVEAIRGLGFEISVAYTPDPHVPDSGLEMQTVTATPEVYGLMLSLHMFAQGGMAKQPQGFLRDVDRRGKDPSSFEFWLELGADRIRRQKDLGWEDNKLDPRALFDEEKLAHQQRVADQQAMVEFQKGRLKYAQDELTAVLGEYWTF